MAFAIKNYFLIVLNFDLRVQPNPKIKQSIHESLKSVVHKDINIFLKIHPLIITVMMPSSLVS